MLTLVPLALTLVFQPHEMAPQAASEDGHEVRPQAGRVMMGSNGEVGDQIQRIVPPTGEDITSRPGREGLLYNAGDVSTDTKLPVGYPRPTPPGAIEIKTYPSIRQAEYSGSGDGTGAGRNGFMPLFQHISTNDIAMTAPVEMRYTDTDGDATTDRWTMAFLYHTPENGPVGSDGDVVILDTEPVTVVSIGIQGGASLDSDGGDPLRTLEAWLEASTEWERAGDTRRLGYNGPYVPVRNRWWELQIPIKPTGSAEQAEDAESETI